MSEMLMGIKIEGHASVPDGTQVWLKGDEVVDITNDEQVKFMAMFGLMRIPSESANRVLLSVDDYEAFAISARALTQEGEGSAAQG